MRTVCHNDRNILCRKAAVRQQIFNQMRHYPVLPHPEAGHIADHQRNMIPRLYTAAERFPIDRIIQTAAHTNADIRNRSDIVSEKLRLHQAFIQRDLHTAAAVCKSIFFHDKHQ